MSEWKVKSLAEVVSQITDKVSVGKDPTKPYIGLEHIPSDGAALLGTGNANDSISANNVFKRGDVLLGKLRPRLRKCVRANFDGYCSTDVLVLRASEGIDPFFASKLLSSDAVFTEAIRTEEGTKMPRCSWRSLRNLSLPCPEPSEQRRIATILTTLDEVIEATEKLVEKHQQIKAGLMHDLFTRGLWTQAELARGEHNGTPAEATAKEGQLRPTPEEAPGLYQDSPLGMIPKAWSFASISNLGIVKGGKRLPAGTPFSETPTQFPYLRVTDMVDGWIDDSALEFVDPRIEPLIANYKIFKNDIYVTIAGTLGQFGRIPPHLDGAQLTENAARITEIDQERVCLDFMCAFLRSNLMAPQKFKAYGLGAGVPKLALYQIERFILPLPSIEEQKIAETVLASAQNDIRSNLTHLAKLRQQKQGLMHDLLTGRVWVDAACDA